MAREIPITKEWRDRVVARMNEMKISKSELARQVGCSPSLVGQMLTKDGSSTFVMAFNRVLGIGLGPGQEPRLQREVPPHRIVTRFSPAAVPERMQKIFDWLAEDDVNFPPEIASLVADLNHQERVAAQIHAHELQIVNDDEYIAASKNVQRAEDALIAAQVALRDAKHRFFVADQLKNARDAKYMSLLRPGEDFDSRSLRILQFDPNRK